MVKEEEDELHIAMFPWLAFGHIIQYLELAKLFAKKGHIISFISTPGNIDRLPKLPLNLSSFINFVKLPLSNLHGLPNDTEATIDLPLKKVPILKKAYDLLQAPITDFLKISKPDWLLYDYMPYWLPEISRSFEIRNACFSTYIASSLAFIGTEYPNYSKSPEDFIVSPKWVPLPSTVAFHKFEALRLLSRQRATTTNGDNIRGAYCFVKAYQGCDVVVVRSCWELEKEWLDQ